MKVNQSQLDLINHLGEQINFLKRSSESFDAGFLSEAKRLALVIRILLHDTNNSTSLLTLLNKKNILFHDTALDYRPSNVLPSMCLIMMKIDSAGASYASPLDEGPPIRYSKAKISFDNWWNKIVFHIPGSDSLTRKDLVLAVSNKDGGAHVDLKLNQAYANLTRFNSLGWKSIVNGKEKDVTNPELYSIRQIAHEILKTLKDEWPEYF